MLKRLGFLVLATVLVMSLLLSGCSSGPKPGQSATVASVTPAPPRGVTGTISVGKTVEAASLKVPTEGGTISVTDSANALKGLELTVPGGSYPEAREFKVSSAPVEKHSFGEDFNPISPLITVENGGGYAEQDMLVSIPVSIPEGNFAMGFFYNKDSGTLEGLPLIAESPTSITITTRHFSSFIISMIPKVQLKKDINTDFLPGKHDWQFRNNGSYIAPNGYCGGQVVSAMWYYSMQPDGANASLYGRYDNNGVQPATPDFSWDDSLGYRLASVVQTDMNWDSWASGFFRNQIGVNDELAWYLFAYSMQLTKQPQLIAVRSTTGGHAMICYRIEGGNLYVADPNYPGDTERRIEYANTKFKPYESGVNREEIEKGNSISYTKIGYFAQSAIVDWNKMSQRWSEFKNKTIGNDKFPAKKVVYIDDKGAKIELKDGYVSPIQTINITLDVGGGTIVYRDGQEVKHDANWNYELVPGVNKLGVFITGMVNGTLKAIDFQYFNVSYSGLAIQPLSQEGPPNEYLTYKAVMDKVPDKARLEWYADGVLKQSDTSTTFKVYFDHQSLGDHTITVKLVDAPPGDPSGKVVKEGKATATIKLPSPSPTATIDYLAILQGMTNLKGAFGGNGIYKYWATMNWDLVPGGPGESIKKRNEQYYFPWYRSGEANAAMKITWSGLTFSGSNANQVNTVGSSEEIKGTVSADGKMLTSFTHTYTYKNSDPVYNTASESAYTLILQNIPIPVSSGSSINFRKAGPELQSSVTTCQFRSTSFKNGEKVTEMTLTSPDWSDTVSSGQPSLFMEFSK